MTNLKTKFAIAAMQALIAARPGMPADDLATASWEIAEAMIAHEQPERTREAFLAQYEGMC